jgi:Transcription-repair coupling factor (superfamily II helicase)
VAAKPLHTLLLDALIHRPHAAGVTLVVTASSRESDQVRLALRSLSADMNVWELPAWETLPHERMSPHPETVARRLSAIRAVSTHSPGDIPLVIVASVRALIQPVNPELGELSWLRLEAGPSTDLETWAEQLTRMAYQRVDLVTRRGEFAIRGGILDVFPLWPTTRSERISLARISRRSPSSRLSISAPCKRCLTRWRSHRLEKCCSPTMCVAERNS